MTDVKRDLDKQLDLNEKVKSYAETTWQVRTEESTTKRQGDLARSPALFCFVLFIVLVISLPWFVGPIRPPRVVLSHTRQVKEHTILYNI